MVRYDAYFVLKTLDMLKTSKKTLGELLMRLT